MRTFTICKAYMRERVLLGMAKLKISISFICALLIAVKLPCAADDVVPDCSVVGVSALDTLSLASITQPVQDTIVRRGGGMSIRTAGWTFRRMKSL